MYRVEHVVCQGFLAHLEDEVVPENKVGDAGYENEDGREDSSPQENDTVRLWQLYQVSNLEASDVIYGKECKQGLQATQCDQQQIHAATERDTTTCNRTRHQGMQQNETSRHANPGVKVPAMW